MNRLTLVLEIVAGVLLACVAAQSKSGAQLPATLKETSAAQSSVQDVNDAFVAKIKAQIAGHEQEPAEKVFKNIQISNLKNTPAERFLAIMNLGYGHALGVACTYCHVEDNFASDEKRPKRAAREMAVMHRAINEQLSKMQNLAPNPDGHFINCTTCHRGAIDPMATSR